MIHGAVRGIACGDKRGRTQFQQNDAEGEKRANPSRCSFPYLPKIYLCVFLRGYVLRFGCGAADSPVLLQRNLPLTLSSPLFLLPLPEPWGKPPWSYEACHG
ncbi:unnamed protein product [Arctogadus glacialis]